MDFKLTSAFKPTGDQPQAIEELTKGIFNGDEYQVLLGVTGSGKTYTIANVIQNLNRPTLILSHNKTLAAQLYSEFKQFFPDNAVEYFVSYYDYYQPEAYLPTTNTYIEKDLSINDEIEKLRLSATSALLSGRRDVIVVSSVSCIYGLGNPEDFTSNVIELKVGDVLGRDVFLRKLVDSLYSRSEIQFDRSNFRVKGDTVDVYPAYADHAFRISFWGDEIEGLEIIDPLSGHHIESLDYMTIYPATIFVTTKDKMNDAIKDIQLDLGKQITFFQENGSALQAKRLEDRVSYDVEMLKELGYCSGIENYSRYFDGRKTGSRPFCLLDYFPDDFLMVIDESHVTVSQIRAMYGGDRSRKQVLVEHGFRLPSAMDNRPLKFDEFESIVNQIIYVSATPADYELQQSQGVVVEQLIRPTGLLDPPIEVKPSLNQIDDLLDEIDRVVKKGERVLVTTLTKRMAEELTKYLMNLNIKTSYIHSDVDTLERVEIMHNLRKGSIDVLVGVNLLREGLDLPEVSLVAILDADKEGFLRSTRALTQTAGRAARNINSKVIMYADKVTDSMQRTIDETARRREIQLAYNEKHHITPKQIVKPLENVLGDVMGKNKSEEPKPYIEPQHGNSVAADPVVEYMSVSQLHKAIDKIQKEMRKVVKDLDFIEAARLRDEMLLLEERLRNMEG
jgi:excinuclease ABC subunit B